MLHSWKIRYLFFTTNPLAKDSFPGIAGDCPWRGLGGGATGWIMLQVLPAILWPSPSHVWGFWFQCRPIPSELWVFKIAFLHSSLIVSLHLFETEIDDLYIVHMSTFHQIRSALSIGRCITMVALRPNPTMLMPTVKWSESLTRANWYNGNRRAWMMVAQCPSLVRHIGTRKVKSVSKERSSSSEQRHLLFISVTLY